MTRCEFCTSDDVRIEHSGFHYRTRSGKQFMQRYRLYHCNTCGKNFEVTGDWQPDPEADNR